MKNLYVLLLVTVYPIFLTASNRKESKTRYYRHELSICIGGMDVRSDWSDDYERMAMDEFGLVVPKCIIDGVVCCTYEKPRLSFSDIFKSISYYYHLNHHFAIGGLFSYGNVDDELVSWCEPDECELYKTGPTYVHGSSFILMPSIKWTWLNNRWCSLYMKATAGFHYQKLHLDSESISKDQTDAFKNKAHLSLGYYITPFGWEIGKQKIRWFMEFGLGKNTNFQTGIKFRFGRY